MEFFNGIILAEINSDTLERNLSEDVVDSTLKGVTDAVTFYKLPSFIQTPIQFFHPSIFPPKSIFSTVVELNKGISFKEEFTAKYLEKMDEMGVDILVCPAQLFPAPPTSVLGDFVACISPYVPWNVMDCPAGIAPVTTWTAEDQKEMKTYPTKCEEQKKVKQYCKGAEGLPLAVQVVGRPYDDEQVLRILSELGRNTLLVSETETPAALQLAKSK